MPRKTKDAPGRVTPKGGPVKRSSAGSAGTGSQTGGGHSGRYTPPIPREFRSSPWWVPALILAFFGAGILVILLNYMGVLGTASNVYLFAGLGCIVAGFIGATRWH
jgi:cell division protein CrgA